MNIVALICMAILFCMTVHGVLKGQDGTVAGFVAGILAVAITACPLWVLIKLVFL